MVIMVISRKRSLRRFSYLVSVPVLHLPETQRKWGGPIGVILEMGVWG